MMRQRRHELSVATDGARLYEISDEVERFVAESDIGEGLLTIFLRHTSASLVIQENADPDVARDLEDFFGRLVPEGDPAYRHRSEGPDDMPAHIKGALTQSQLSIPVADGRAQLGTWQGIFVFEHRRRPHRRSIILHLIGQ